jgi:hypothetical protein
MNITVILIILIFAALPVLAGLIVLQVFLSRKENKWYGLILPAVFFLLSFIYPLNIMDTGDTWQNIWLFFSSLLLANIPTAVFLIIYFASGENRRKKAQLKKMNIQDLG